MCRWIFSRLNIPRPKATWARRVVCHMFRWTIGRMFVLDIWIEFISGELICKSHLTLLSLSIRLDSDVWEGEQTKKTKTKWVQLLVKRIWCPRWWRLQSGWTANYLFRIWVGLELSCSNQFSVEAQMDILSGAAVSVAMRLTCSNYNEQHFYYSQIDCTKTRCKHANLNTVFSN